jgi:hypothetical protein
MGYPTKEELLKKGYTSLGKICCQEWLVNSSSEVDDTYYYFVLSDDGIALWSQPHRIEAKTLRALQKTRDYLFSS